MSGCGRCGRDDGTHDVKIRRNPDTYPLWTIDCGGVIFVQPFISSGDLERDQHRGEQFFRDWASA